VYVSSEQELALQTQWPQTAISYKSSLCAIQYTDVIQIERNVQKWVDC